MYTHTYPQLWKRMKSRKLSHVHTFTAPTTNTTKLTNKSKTYQKTDLSLIIYRAPTKIAQRILQTRRVFTL